MRGAPVLAGGDFCSYVPGPVRLNFKLNRTRVDLEHSCALQRTGVLLETI
jgi:hypothetical protein